MIDLVKKTMMTGIGLALKTKDEVESLAAELIKKGAVTEKEGTKFVEDLLKRYDESKKKLEDKVEGIVKDVLKKANLATADDVKALKDEIGKLKKEIGKDK
ncbi:MAG: hypothetical protein K9L30_00080 [Desulfobacterales bacterium]|nr:hypothetical protein [Desulfobacterales bacterium]